MNDFDLQLAGLSLFHYLKGDKVVRALRALLGCAPDDRLRRTEAYALLTSLLLDNGGNLSEYVLQLALRAENQYVRLRAADKPIAQELTTMLERELGVLEEISRLTPQALGFDLPGWRVSALDFKAAYQARMNAIKEKGFGIFSEHHMFLLRGHELVPVVHPDPVLLSNLTGYQQERKQVLDNTIALLKNRPAANVLLYGDSGTGKSTTVKAVANELKEQGLRLIELRKDQLDAIPMLIDLFRDNPLKFVLFIDDLSFVSNSEHLASLKAILEGSVSLKTANMVIYATSNRRHLVRERFSERQGDEVHLRDTLEELGSLSERFGLLITFLRPEREIYLAIVENYLARFAITFNDDIRRQAEAFAIERGGRSARTAKQFAERLASSNHGVSI